VTQLELAKDGDVVFRFAPFQTAPGCPTLQLQGRTVTSEFPTPGTITALPEGSCEGASQQEHEQTVQQALDAIEAGTLEKVVVSRSEFWETRRTPEEVFKAKCEAYPDAFVYLFAHGLAGAWIGATPEVLLVRDGELFETTALAGTKADAQRDWTDKERHEQALVADFIEQNLRGRNARGVNIDEAASMAYGTLQHLQSKITFRSEEDVDFWLDALHPTPAVGGTPRDKALDFIANHESGERRYYTGFLGTTEGDRAAFYVNLRCMQCFANGFRLFAGGGIVEGSDPAKEWKETRDKIESIRAGIAAQ
jgi:isochorismate synthase